MRRARKRVKKIQPKKKHAPPFIISKPTPLIIILLCVFLPFALGYFVSFVFRTVNATIAPQLTDDFNLDAERLGLLTSAYFFTLALAQIPLGAALDRYGPRRVQSVLFLCAAAGALLFANATSVFGLFLGRALIGLGVASALLAGLKANSQWLPRERLSLYNGIFIAFGASGSVAATVPVEWLLTQTDWRGLFQLLSIATGVIAFVIFFIVPDLKSATSAKSAPKISFGEIYADRRFLRLAPVSALCVGSAWSLQGLWAAPWFMDVASLARPQIVHNLLVMAIALSVGALSMGIVADFLNKKGVGPEKVFTACALILVVSETALALRVAVSPIVAWCAITAMGAMTVLSFSILAKYFPKEVAGRANAALNVLHIGGAFALQCGIGFVIGIWARDALGHYPEQAYSTVLAVLAMLQVAALLWFSYGHRLSTLASSLRGFKPGGIPSMDKVRFYAPSARASATKSSLSCPQNN